MNEWGDSLRKITSKIKAIDWFRFPIFRTNWDVRDDHTLFVFSPGTAKSMTERSQSRLTFTREQFWYRLLPYELVNLTFKISLCGSCASLYQTTCSGTVCCGNVWLFSAKELINGWVDCWQKITHKTNAMWLVRLPVSHYMWRESLCRDVLLFSAKELLKIRCGKRHAKYKTMLLERLPVSQYIWRESLLRKCSFAEMEASCAEIICKIKATCLLCLLSSFYFLFLFQGRWPSFDKTETFQRWQCGFFASLYHHIFWVKLWGVKAEMPEIGQNWGAEASMPFYVF